MCHNCNLGFKNEVIMIRQRYSGTFWIYFLNSSVLNIAFCHLALFFICAAHHEWLLSDDVDILPFLMLPLAGPEELTEKENDGEALIRKLFWSI